MDFIHFISVIRARKPFQQDTQQQKQSGLSMNEILSNVYAKGIYDVVSVMNRPSITNALGRSSA